MIWYICQENVIYSKPIISAICEIRIIRGSDFTLDTTLNFCENNPMPRKNKILNIGDTAPLFSLLSHRRQNVSLTSYRDEQHVILTFFRGTW